MNLDVQAGIDREKRKSVRAIATAYGNVSLLSTYDLFASNGKVTVVADRVPWFWDDDHVTVQGASTILDRLRETMAALLSNSD